MDLELELLQQVVERFSKLYCNELTGLSNARAGIDHGDFRIFVHFKYYDVLDSLPFEFEGVRVAPRYPEELWCRKLTNSCCKLCDSCSFKLNECKRCRKQLCFSLD